MLRFRGRPRSGRRARALLLSLLLSCAACGLWAPRTQAQDSPTVATDIAVREDKVEAKKAFGSLNGFSSYGATLGGMRVFGGDLAKGAQVRPLLQAAFRYRFTDRWIATGEFGMGWNSFADRGDTVATFNFGSIGALRQVGLVKGAIWRAGGGVGMYRWNYKISGKSVRDPITQRFYRGFVPGLFLGTELERRATRHVTVTAALQQHYVFTGANRFESLYDSNHSFVGLRFGVHYHFSPYEGILWERKESKKIRLTSGQAGK
ncbi:MAG: hypothetical protein U0527_17310 [Candidatus Eisenbacteria bacterium]